jgi:CheY-like chemotaxis protein
MKIIIVEDNQEFVSFLTEVIRGRYPSCNIVHFTNSTKAACAVSTSDADFDALFLDGHLGFGGNGIEVLNVLSEDQLKKVVVVSGSSQFAKDCIAKGVNIRMEKDFPGIMGSEVPECILETLKKVTG